MTVFGGPLWASPLWASPLWQGPILVTGNAAVLYYYYQYIVNAT